LRRVVSPADFKSPGTTDADKFTVFPSELATSLIGNRKPEEEPWQDPRFIPAQKFGGDEEMGGTILYLASMAGSYCNGLIMVMDGGRVAMLPSAY